MAKQTVSPNAGKVRHIPWDMVRTEYVTAETPITLAELATKHQINRATIYVKAGAEKWTKQREDFWLEVMEAAKQQLKSEFQRQRVHRAILVGKAIERWMRRLEDKEEYNVSELLQLLKLERDLLEVDDGKPDAEAEFEVYVAKVRARISSVNPTLGHVVDSGLRRLGLAPGTSGEDGLVEA
jgi:hypothetical protein